MAAHKIFTNVPMVISNDDPLIKDDCIICGNSCDQAYGDVTKARRYNERGNFCLKHDMEANQRAWRRLHPIAAAALEQRTAQ